LPKEIQPTEAAAMLHYETTFHPYLSFLLMERRYKTLQHMFDDAQEVEDNLQACQRMKNQNLESVENTKNDGVEEEHEIVHKQVDLHPDLHPDHFQHEKKMIVPCIFSKFSMMTLLPKIRISLLKRKLIY
jgi:hypothetical protein